jgi:hypothetical protein
MSISLATKGIIAQIGGWYPVYVPMEEPTIGTEGVGSIGVYSTSLEVDIRGKVVEPDIKPKELKPKMKAE